MKHSFFSQAQFYRKRKPLVRRLQDASLCTARACRETKLQQCSSSTSKPAKSRGPTTSARVVLRPIKAQQRRLQSTSKNSSQNDSSDRESETSANITWCAASAPLPAISPPLLMPTRQCSQRRRLVAPGAHHRPAAAIFPRS